MNLLSSECRSRTCSCSRRRLILLALPLLGLLSFPSLNAQELRNAFMEAINSEDAAEVVDHVAPYVRLCEENQAWIRDEAKPYIPEGFELVGNHRNDGALSMLAMRKSDEELVFYFNIDQLSLDALRTRTVDSAATELMADQADYFFTEVVEATLNDRRRISITGTAWGGTIANYLATKHNVPAIAFDALPLPPALLQNLEQLHVSEDRQVSYNFQKDAGDIGAWSAMARNRVPEMPAPASTSLVASIGKTTTPPIIETVPPRTSVATAMIAPAIAAKRPDLRVRKAEPQGVDIIVDRAVAPAFNDLFHRIDMMELRQRVRAARALTRIVAAPPAASKTDRDQSFDPANTDQAELSRRASAGPAGAPVVSVPEPQTAAPVLENTLLSPELPTVSAPAFAASSVQTPVATPTLVEAPAAAPTPVELPPLPLLVPDQIEPEPAPGSEAVVSGQISSSNPETELVDSPASTAIQEVESDLVQDGEKSDTDEESAPEEGPADFTSLSTDTILVTSERDEGGSIRAFNVQGFHVPPDLESRAIGVYEGPAHAIRQPIDNGATTDLAGTATFQANIAERSISGRFNLEGPNGSLLIDVPATDFDGTFNSAATGSDGSVGTASGRTFGEGGTELGATASIGNAVSRTEAVTVGEWRPVGTSPAPERAPEIVPTEPSPVAPASRTQIYRDSDNTFSFLAIAPGSVPSDVQSLASGIGQPQILGPKTPSASVPNKGVAEYDGQAIGVLAGGGVLARRVVGKLNATANFNDRTVTGNISNMGPIPQLNFRLSTVGNQMNGLVNGSGFTGTMDGHYYGDNVQEIGGGLSASSQNQDLRGAWAGRRTTALPTPSAPVTNP